MKGPGHVPFMGEIINAYRVLFGRLERKRSHRRCRCG
jgi:hypothetical protein